MPKKKGGATTAVAAAGLDKRFTLASWIPGRRQPAVHALQGIDLTVTAGTIHGIIGPNGSGKSTLLRTLATLIVPDGGTAEVNGHDIAAAAMSVRRSVGFTTGEERSLYWRLTARQNLEFAAALHHLDAVDAAIARVLEIADLADTADRPVSGFSQGMMRRLGLARALLHTPVVLLLDEPTRSLDPVARDAFHQVVIGLRDESRVTTLLTTHDLDEAATVCDVVSVLKEGRMVATVEGATPRKLERTLRTP